MKDKNKVLGILGTVAPALATALGGPLAGVAVRAISDKLLDRPDGTAEDIEAAIIGAGPADLVRLKEIEAEFAAEMEKAGIELERIAASDRASARDRQVQTNDRAPAVLAVVMVLGFFGVLAYIARFGLPSEGGPVLALLVGALATGLGQVLNYYFGSSTGSKSKEAIIATLKGRT